MESSYRLGGNRRMKKKPTSQRVYRQLTPQERKRLDDARTETNGAQEKILAEGRLRKEAWEAMRPRNPDPE